MNTNLVNLQEEYKKTEISKILRLLDEELVGLAPVKARIREIAALLLVDKSLEPTNGKIAVSHIDGEFTVKRIKITKGVCWLVPANDNYNPIQVTEDNDFLVWGIVIHVIKSF